MSADLSPEAVQRMLEIAEKATPGPWELEPDTLAGSVWVSRRGSPLCEPVNPRDWKGRLSRMFKMRADSVFKRFDEASGDYGDRRWRTVEANAQHIATFDPPTVRALLEEIVRLRKQLAPKKPSGLMAALCKDVERAQRKGARLTAHRNRALPQDPPEET